MRYSIPEWQRQPFAEMTHLQKTRYVAVLIMSLVFAFLILVYPGLVAIAAAYTGDWINALVMGSLQVFIWLMFGVLNVV